MEIKIPHNYEPREYQLDVLKSKARFKVIVFHRRSGKTLTALNEQIRKAMGKKGVYAYILPTFKQAKRVIWQDPAMLDAHIPPEIIKRKNDSELFIEFVNGSMWYLLGADDPDKVVRGMNMCDVVLDEYAEMKTDVWPTLRPMLDENKGTATFIFTPKGRNHAWKMFEYAKQNKGEWQAWLQTSKTTNVFTDEELENIKKDPQMTEAFFNQEYMCDFVEGAGQFFKRIDVNIGDHEDIYPSEGRLFQTGVDLGKYQDWTVITAVDKHTWEVSNPERFNQIDWNLQKSKIESTVFRFNNARCVVDATGLGDPVVDDLAQRGVSIEAFTFTEKTRTELLNNLRVLLEQDLVKLPRHATQLHDELRSFQYELNPETRKTKITVPEGLHDDCVMSLALAVWGLNSKIPEPDERKPSDNVITPIIEKY